MTEPPTKERSIDYDAVRERIRQKMLDAHLRATLERDTYEDGYFNGLASALDEFVRQEERPE